MDPRPIGHNVDHLGGLVMRCPGAGFIAIALLIGAYVMALGVFALALSLRVRNMGQTLGATQTMA